MRGLEPEVQHRCWCTSRPIGTIAGRVSLTATRAVVDGTRLSRWLSLRPSSVKCAILIDTELFNMLRPVPWRVLAFVVAVFSLGSSVRAESMSVATFGSTDATSLNLVDNTTTWDLTFPAATLTPQVDLLPNNLGLVMGVSTIDFAGLSLTGIVPGEGSALAVPALLTFTTPSGTVTFDTLFVQVAPRFPDALSDGTFGCFLAGKLSGGSYEPTDGFLMIYFNPDGTYGDLSWSLHAVTPVPEPSTLLLLGLGGCGVAVQAGQRKVRGCGRS